VLGAGQQFVAYGYHPDTGLPYTWYLDGEPSALTRFSRDALPELTCDAAIGWANRFDEMAGSLGWKLIADPSRATKNAKPAARLAGKRLDVRDEELEEVVSAIPDPQDYNQWIRVGMCLRHQAEDPQAGLVIWKKWSSQAANFDSDACDRKWTTFCHEGKETYLTGKTLYRLAGRPAPDRDTAADLPLSEDAVARAFAERHVENLRYDHDLGKWMYFDGVRWQKEKTELALDYARDICRELRTECADTRAANALSRASSAAAVERLARSDRTFAVVSDIWDKDRFLLGTPGGTVDLCSGVLRPTCREHCITMITAVAPLASCSPEVDMPVFWKFLKEVTSGDMEVINYLQRFGGYCLTGDTREQMLLFVHGPGGNGKSLFQSIIAEIIGEYAWTAPPEMFTSSRSERHPTELASLRGKRLVIASENETGKAWAEVRIKQVTGGDRITARLMRQDFFEFDLRAKFFFVGNNQPTLKQVDEAMKRRFHVLEFAYSPDKPDKGLAAKLKPEWPAILRWLIDGCLAWQREGLAPPEAIVAATEEYFDEQDVVKEWLELSCEIGPDYAVANMDIKESFQQFSQSRGGIVCSDPLPALRQRFTRIKNKCGVRGRGLLGLRLKIPEEET
jgi:putative DNA primase/helicase